MQSFNEEQSHSTTLEPSKSFKTRAIFDSMEISTKQFYMFDNDTGEIIDLRTSQIVEYDQIQFQKENAWQDFWKESQLKTLELIKACKQGQFSIVESIMQSSNFIDINAKDSNDQTCLHFACSSGNFQIAYHLIQKGSLVNEQDCDGYTPLMVSVKNNHIDLVTLLLYNKANVDRQDFLMNTPLHIALDNNCLEIITILLKYKADPYIQNAENLNALQLISNTDQQQIFKQFGYEKQYVGERLVQSTKESKESKDFNSSYRKSISRIMKFLGQSVPTNSLSKQNYQARQSVVPIGGNNIGPDSFTYHKELGKGSFGVVYLVKKKDEQNSLYAMKVLRKEKISQKLLPYIQTEKSILSVIDHPFIVKLHYAFQSECKLFLVMDFCPGGDLTKLLDLKQKLQEQIAKMYTAEIILAIEALHQNKIMYRDLKPQNIIIDNKGHCMLTDFGLAKTDIENEDTKSFCGTPAYMAPEVVNKKLYNRSVDWYQLGTITHEMLFGMPPYYSHNREELFENIKNKQLKFPQNNLSKDALSFISQLLERNPSKRLGAKKDSEEVKAHSWFQGINWDDVMNKKLPVPMPSIMNQANQTIQVNFEEDSQIQQKKAIDNWTFISD
ncbi:unnamed protein product [Paramecium sonneborni]|uniref:Protein kinase domain-containing protein n=1 Tax=Paramecium sonneborni TaxID=65129 RepID=A0A8S1JXH9_9CILI|nr:unnamed protein product [Paramecium sonneborni]